MRKKLEKGAVQQLKTRIAQQNRQAGGGTKQNGPPVDNDNNDSDMEPTEKPHDNDMGGSSAVNPTQVQLNPAQLEEVKLMT